MGAFALWMVVGVGLGMVAGANGSRAVVLGCASRGRQLNARHRKCLAEEIERPKYSRSGLGMIPVVAAGVTDRLWDVNDLVALREQYERRVERAA
jgi:hypothetical protein